MIYNSDNLPSQVKRLEDLAQKTWLSAYQIAVARNQNDIQASKIAWKVVRGLFENPIRDFQMYITKANYDKDGKMQFAATASDTSKDVYKERMSLELFKSFMQNFSGQEFVSLAHYPRLSSGKGEAGLVTKLYVDGEYLKCKGYFHDTELGRQCFKSIVKDREENINVEKRVRVSIGFYDRKHVHENSNTTWEYISGKPCLKCLAGKVDDKVYLDGHLEHVALTRRPANKRTEIEIEE